MNVEAISDASLLVYDTLKDDDESQEILEMIDEAGGDEELKEGLKRAVIRLDDVNPAVAKAVREKLKGFVY